VSRLSRAAFAADAIATRTVTNVIIKVLCSSCTVGGDDSVFRLNIPFAQFGKYFPSLGHFLESVPISWYLNEDMPILGTEQADRLFDSTAPANKLIGKTS